MAAEVKKYEVEDADISVDKSENGKDIVDKLHQQGKLDAANTDKAPFQLSVAEQKQVDAGKTDIPKLVAEKQQIQKEMENRLAALSADNAIEPKENARLLREMENLGPEQLRLLQGHIEDIAEQEAEKTEELEPNDKRLLKIEGKFKSLLHKDSNRKYLGGPDSIAKYDEWIKAERIKNPTIKHLEECLNDFAYNANADGLKKRQVFYEKELAPMFKKYGFSTPMASKYVQQNGMKNREPFLENARDMEKELRNFNDDLYSEKSIRSEMRDVLTAKNPQAQKERIQKAKKCSEIENNNYIALSKSNNTVTIGKHQIPAMSARSMDFLLENHKREGVGSEKRLQSAQFWPSSMKFLKGLAKDLEKSLENHPELLDKAVGIFKDLTDDAKIKFVKEYQQLAENTESSEEVEAKAMINAATAEIEQAKRGKYICDKTAERYKKGFDPKNFQDKKTGRFDLPKLEERFRLLTNPQAVTEQKDRNLAAYFKEHQKYLDSLEKYKELNPDMDKRFIDKRREDYEKLTWKKKIANHKKLKEEIKDKEHDLKKVEKVSEEADVDIKPETKEANESNLEWGLLLKRVAVLEAEGQYGEIVGILLEEYNAVLLNPEASEKDEKLLWEKLTHYRTLMKEFGKGRKEEENVEEELEKNMQELAENDEEIIAELETQQVQRIGIDLAEMSERRYGGSIEAQEKSRKESLQHTEDGSDEQKLTEDYYDIASSEGDGDKVLDKHGQAKEITETDLNEQVDSTRTERQKLKQKLYKDQNKLSTKEGDTSYQVKDGKTGRIVTGREGRAIQEKEIQNLESLLTEKAIDKTEEKTGNVFDLNERIAMQRSEKARKVIDDNVNERLDSAA